MSYLLAMTSPPLQKGNDSTIREQKSRCIVLFLDIIFGFALIKERTFSKLYCIEPFLHMFPHVFFQNSATTEETVALGFPGNYSHFAFK